MTDYSAQIARELTIRPQQAQAVIRLLAEKATIPFIARYRKEATGSLDEVTVTAIRDRLQALQVLDQRRASIRNALEERGLLDSQLSQALEKASTLAALEDLLKALPANTCSIELPNTKYIAEYGGAGHAKRCLDHAKAVFKRIGL